VRRTCARRDSAPCAAQRGIEVQFAGYFGSYVAEALDGIVETAAEEGVSVVISKPDGSPHWARDLVSAGRRALIAVTSVYTAAHLDALAQAGLPLVVLDPPHLPHNDEIALGVTRPPAVAACASRRT
jgi:LacI family transcriptional regulator